MKYFVFLVALAASLQAETLAIRPGNGARFAFQVEKTGLMSGKIHDFTFDRFTGTADVRPNDLAHSKVEFALEVASLACHDEWSPAKGSLAKIVKEALSDTLQSGRFPEIRFRSNSIVPAGGDQYEVKGDLTLRGVTKPVTVMVTAVRQGAAAMADGKSTFRMTDFGIKPPSAALGTIGTKPEVRVSFHLPLQ